MPRKPRYNAFCRGIHTHSIDESQQGLRIVGMRARASDYRMIWTEI